MLLWLYVYNEQYNVNFNVLGTMYGFIVRENDGDDKSNFGVKKHIHVENQKISLV